MWGPPMGGLGLGALQLLTGSYDKTVAVWDVATGNMGYKFEAHSAQVRYHSLLRLLEPCFVPIRSWMLIGSLEAMMGMQYLHLVQRTKP